MDTYKMNPDNMRAPNNLSPEEIRKSLEELDAKIKTLKAKVNATTADSNHTYHEHIAALEKKRSLLTDKLNSSEENQSKWQDIRTSINSLLDDVNNIFK
ncbi:sll1863 family stress response protein [Pontibacter arcticus]|uniref:Uncharacterized protein n=1 Tax=Pontibacter arcticus TaxID=2080288 RepID=A0A364RBQ7_9BACT|nr:hypothetical protein [Pontibacter arcticus]RAU81685.1 hypothetical protein DP923_13315 [Pontibacter arcticus]